MVVFHDVILVDDDYILTKRHQDRYWILSALVRRVEGHAHMREAKLIDFSKPNASISLRQHYSSAIAKGWEGLVLKPDDEAFFSFKQHNLGKLSAAWIKLKKDYIAGLGDTADFTIIGGSYDGREASSLGIKGLRWTSFHVGCLMNKEEVSRFEGKPQFREIDVLHPPNVQKTFIERLNRLGYFQEEKYERGAPNEHFEVRHDQSQLRKMTHLFKQPIVVDLMGASFEKPSGVGYFTLRFPRLQKIHEDRSFKDAVSFDELQKLADEARNVPADMIEEEEINWNARLKATRVTPSQTTPSEDSYCTTERESETSPRIRNQKWSVTPTGPSMRYNYSTSPTPTKPKAVPMVRMDSREMRPGETRLGSGEVVEINPNTVLPTPPSTSSQRDRSKKSPPKKRKAPTEILEADLNMPVPPRKRFAPPTSKTPPMGHSPVIVAPAMSVPTRHADRPNEPTGSSRASSIANKDSRKRKPSVHLPSIYEESTDDEESQEPARPPKGGGQSPEVQVVSSSKVRRPAAQEQSIEK